MYTESWPAGVMTWRLSVGPTHDDEAVMNGAPDSVADLDGGGLGWLGLVGAGGDLG